MTKLRRVTGPLPIACLFVGVVAASGSAHGTRADALSDRDNAHIGDRATLSARQAVAQPTQAPAVMVSAEDQQAIEALVARLYDARVKRDVAALAALWFSKAPRRVTPYFPPEYVFPYYRLEAGAASLSRVTQHTIFISARVTVPVTVVLQPNETARATQWVRNMQFVKENDAWRIYSETPATDDLALDVVTARTEEARHALLDAEPDLVNEDLVFALESQGDRLASGGGFRNAIAIYELELKLAEQVKSVAGAARAHLKIGQMLQVPRDPAAVEQFKLALAGFTALADRPRIARTEIALASSYYMVDDQASQEHYKAGVDVLEMLPDRVEFARALHGYGNACFMTGDYTNATDAYSRSMAILEAAGVKSGIPSLLQALGRVQKEQADFDAALASYDKSLADKTLLDSGLIFGAMSGRADVFRLQGRFDLALEEYGRLLALVQTWNDPQSLMQLEADIGHVYMSEQQPAGALDHYQNSLKLAEQLGNSAGMARALAGAGAADFADQRFDAALDAFTRGLALYETLRDKGAVAWSHAHIALVQSARDRHDEALAAGQQALDLCNELGDRAAASAMQTLLAMEHLALDRPDQAIELADRAAALARDNESYDTLAKARVVAGQAWRRKGDREGAARAFSEAIAAVEDGRARAGEEPRDDFFGDTRGPYRAMALAMAEAGRPADALAYAERSQIALLSNILTGSRALLTGRVPPDVQEQERQINRTFKSLRRQAQKEQGRPTPDAKRLEDLKARLSDADRQRKAFFEKLYADYPAVKVQRGLFEPAGLADVSGEVDAAGQTAVLEFVTSDTQTLLFVMTGKAEPAPPLRESERTGQARPALGDTTVSAVRSAPPAVRASVEVYTIDVNALELARRVRDFRALVARRDKGTGKAGRDLFDLLLGPAKDALTSRTRLVIVPDGPLWSLPFQALQVADGKYLIERAAISYAPSLTALVLLRNGQLAPDAPSHGRHVVSVGNEVAGDATERLSLLHPRATLQPMPHAEQEARALALVYGARRTRVFVGKAAAPDAVSADARTAALLHLATFFVPSAASPLRSPIVFSPTANGNQAGVVEMWELMKSGVPPRVVVSRVQAERLAGDGSVPVGLTWALFVGGARTTVLATWPDDSAGAVTAMTGLHRALAQPGTTRSMSTALRRAILPMLATPFRHPFYWANYAVVGID